MKTTMSPRAIEEFLDDARIKKCRVVGESITLTLKQDLQEPFEVTFSSGRTAQGGQLIVETKSILDTKNAK